MEAGGEPGLGAMKITPSRTARLDGFFAMNIDYRLVNSTSAPACYQDMYTAIRWVHVHAAEYHIDTSRICLMGNSSGGHEVALAATLGEGPYGKTGGWDKEFEDFRAAISFSGAYDLNTLSWGNLWTPVAGSATTGFTTLAVQRSRKHGASPRPCKISVCELRRCCP
jgi:hypothetical protein